MEKRMETNPVSGVMNLPPPLYNKAAQHGTMIYLYMEGTIYHWGGVYSMSGGGWYYAGTMLFRFRIRDPQCFSGLCRGCFMDRRTCSV